MKRIGTITLMLVLLALAGCAPGPKVPEEVEEVAVCYPYDLGTEVDDGEMTVMWKTRCNRIISGYNIYISEKPLTESYPGTEPSPDVLPFNFTPFAGDTDPSDGVEHFVAQGLENGVKYHVSVRIVLPDLTLSLPSNEVTAVCGPRGEIELSVRYASDRDGYSFAHDQYVRADNVDNDVYFYHKDGRSYLASPHRLGGFLRTSTFEVLLHKGDLSEVKDDIGEGTAMPGQERVEVTEGDWVWIVTADRCQVLAKVLSLHGKDDKRRIKLFYAYNPKPGSLVF